MNTLKTATSPTRGSFDDTNRHPGDRVGPEFMLAKNLLFWGSIGLTGALLHAVYRAILG